MVATPATPAGDRILADATDQMLIGVADRHYVDRDWRTALPLYQAVHDRNPALSAQFGLALTIGHCMVELDDPAILPTCAPSEDRRVAVMLNDMRTRAYEICRAGEFARAVRLLRFMAGACPILSGTYGDGLLDPASPVPDGSDPGVAAEFLSETTIARLKQRHHGARLLLVERRFNFNDPQRQYEFVDCAARSARQFGMTVREFNSHWMPPDVPREFFPATLLDAINDYKPTVIFFDELFASGLSASSPEMGEQIATVLEMARRQYGTRVIKSYHDAWFVPLDAVYRGLGTCVDLVSHCHPEFLPHASAAERARTVCDPGPHQVAEPTVPWGEIPRASFVGSIYSFNYPRIAWWAELMQRGLPVDFMPWIPSDWAKVDPNRTIQRSDTEFSNLLHGHRFSLDFTRRSTGVKILTGRTLQVPMAGGVLLVEDSANVRFFMQPGVHYVPFRTLGDLEQAMGALSDDEPARRRLSEEGRRWTRRYFTGEQYWARALDKLFA